MAKMDLKGLFRGPTFAPFEHGAFRMIWTASLLANSGAVIQSVGASWMMTTLAPTADYVALVQAASMAPTMLLSIASGALADIVDRRKVMLAAQITMLTASGVLAAMAWAHMVGVWSLLGLTFLIGCGTTLYGPSWQASISEQVSREKLPAAVALNSIGFNLARSTAPALGGAIVALGGAALSFTLNAFSYVGLIAVLTQWRRAPAAPSIAPETFGRAMAAGLRYVTRAPPLRGTLIRGAALGLGGAALWSMMPLVARDLIGGGPFLYGVLLAAFGGGAMAGGFSSVHLRSRYGSYKVMVYSTVVFATASIIVGLSPLFALTFLSLMVAGGCWVLAIATFNTAVQTSTPAWVAGRALSIYQMITFGSLAVGSVLWGQAAHKFGLREVLVTAGLLLLASQVVFRYLLPRLEEELDLDPAGSLTSHLPPLELDPNTGPIVIAVEYRVRPADARAFMAAVREFGAIRRRDGATRWSLMQDLDDPELFIEQFTNATWLDHARRQERLTNTDLKVRNQVLAFHYGARPAVRRRADRPPGSEPIETIAPPVGD
jgi:MFS family permease